MAVYAIPTTPKTPSARAALASECQGALSVAATSRAAQKCTIVGVPKAASSVDPVRMLESATSAMTTNWRPVSAAPDEPTMT